MTKNFNKPEIKNKILNLSVGDVLAIIAFGISLGISIQHYNAAIGRIDSIEKDINGFSEHITAIKLNDTLQNISIHNLGDKIKELQNNTK